MKLVFAVLAALALTSTALADANRDKQVEDLRAAIDRGPDAVKPLVERFPLYIQGLRFADATCDKTFGHPRAVPLAELAPFVACLKGMQLVIEGGTFVAEPGVEVNPLFVDGKVSVFSSNGEVPPARAEKHLVATAKIAPDRASKAAIVKRKLPFLAVEIALCVREDGTVESASVERYNAVVAVTWAQQLLAATKKATYTPFQRGGAAVRACTSQRHVYPATLRSAGIAELARLRTVVESAGIEGGEYVEGGSVEDILDSPLPPPPPPPPELRIVPPTLLEKNRIAGSITIEPDAATKAAIAKSGKDRVVGSVKLCIDVAGVVSRALTLKSTGFVDYDTKLLTATRSWKYSPWMDNGSAVPACTAVTFIYYTSARGQ